MFFDHIDEIREMILATDLAGREKALAKLLPFQRKDFDGLFRAMADKPVTFRLLDPPLHEFLPHTAKEQEDLAKKLGLKAEDIKKRVDELHEMNPMLGHRVADLVSCTARSPRCKLARSSKPPAMVQKAGIKVYPEVMIPLVGFKAELDHQAKIVNDTAEKVFRREGCKG